MTIRVSVSPALQRLATLIAMLITIALFLAILIQVGSNQNISLCISNKTLGNTCWDWHLGDYQRSFRCPFTLLFVSLVLFCVSLFVFFCTGFMKCLCPEIILLSNQNICYRLFSQYFVLFLHLSGTVFALSFIIFVLGYSFKVESCYFSGDMMRNCTDHGSYCWMLCLLCFGFIACLFSTMCSAFAARKFYVERLDDEMCDQLYQNSITSSHEYLHTLPT